MRMAHQVPEWAHGTSQAHDGSSPWPDVGALSFAPDPAACSCSGACWRCTPRGSWFAGLPAARSFSEAASGGLPGPKSDPGRPVASHPPKALQDPGARLGQAAGTMEAVACAHVLLEHKQLMVAFQGCRTLKDLTTVGACTCVHCRPWASLRTHACWGSNLGTCVLATGGGPARVGRLGLTRVVAPVWHMQQHAPWVDLY